MNEQRNANRGADRGDARDIDGWLCRGAVTSNRTNHFVMHPLLKTARQRGDFRNVTELLFKLPRERDLGRVSCRDLLEETALRRKHIEAGRDVVGDALTQRRIRERGELATPVLLGQGECRQD